MHQQQCVGLPGGLQGQREQPHSTGRTRMQPLSFEQAGFGPSIRFTRALRQSIIFGEGIMMLNPLRGLHPLQQVLCRRFCGSGAASGNTTISRCFSSSAATSKNVSGNSDSKAPADYHGDAGVGGVGLYNMPGEHHHGDPRKHLNPDGTYQYPMTPHIFHYEDVYSNVPKQQIVSVGGQKMIKGVESRDLTELFQIHQVCTPFVFCLCRPIASGVSFSICGIPGACLIFRWLATEKHSVLPATSHGCVWQSRPAHEGRVFVFLDTNIHHLVFDRYFLTGFRVWGGWEGSLVEGNVVALQGVFGAPPNVT